MEDNEDSDNIVKLIDSTINTWINNNKIDSIIKQYEINKKKINNLIHVITLCNSISYSHLEINRCQLCLVDQLNIVLIPCRHTMCNKCNKGVNMNSPICRQSVKTTNKIYL